MQQVRSLVAILVCAVALAMAAAAGGQQVTYTFSSGPGGDGFDWPPSPTGLLDFESFTTPDAYEIVNFTGNNVFFDDSFQAAGNAQRLGPGNPAMWGNPTDSSAQVNVKASQGSPFQSASFDLAWAIAGQNAPSFLNVVASDSSFNVAAIWVSLGDTFNAGPAFGGFDGREGTVSFQASDFLYEGGGGPVPMNDLLDFTLFVDPVATPGATGEFAIDNLAFNAGGGGGGDPADSDLRAVSESNGQLFELGGIGSNAVRGTFGGTFTFNFEVQNQGTGDTEYSIVVTNDPANLVPDAFYDPYGQTQRPIAAGERIPGGGSAAISTNLQSGHYQGNAAVVNDLNPADANHHVGLGFEVFDLAIGSDNSTAGPFGDGGALTMSNEAAGPHAGALRAALHVTGATLSGAGFSVSGDLLADDVVFAGDTHVATVHFSPVGLTAGTHDGTYTAGLRMTSTNGASGYLNGAPAVPPVTWQLRDTVAEQLESGGSVGAGGNFGAAMIGVRNGNTAADLVDGTSSIQQSVVAQFVTNPESISGLRTAWILGDTVDIDFEALADLYVLQMTYLDAALPAGMAEADLQLLFYDASANGGQGAWVHSIVANSDGGAGGHFFDGSYQAYLDTLALPAMPQLSMFGVDSLANHVWAVLDHHSTFGVGIVPEPAALGILLLAALATLGRRHRC